MAVATASRVLYTTSLGGSEGAQRRYTLKTRVDNQFKMLVGGRLGYTRVQGPADHTEPWCSVLRDRNLRTSSLSFRCISVAHSDPLFLPSPSPPPSYPSHST